MSKKADLLRFFIKPRHPGGIKEKPDLDGNTQHGEP